MRTSVLKRLAVMERQLVDAPRRQLLGGLAWKSDVPAVGGIYAIWSKRGSPKYVGETCHLRHRCVDLGRTVNHTFRKKMAATYGMTGCSDRDLSRKLSSQFLFSYLTIELGRKELEEYLIVKWQKSIINKPPKRLLLRDVSYDF